MPSWEAIREWLFSPISASGLSHLAGLEILQCIPAVKILTFLDLGKNLSFSDSLIQRLGVSPWKWDSGLKRKKGKKPKQKHKAYEYGEPHWAEGGSFRFPVLPELINSRPVLSYDLHV